MTFQKNRSWRRKINIQYKLDNLDNISSKELPLDIPNLTNLSVRVKDIIHLFPLLTGLVQVIYIFILHDLLNLRKELHKLYINKDPEKKIMNKERLMLSFPLWMDPLNSWPKFLFQFAVLSIPFLISFFSLYVILKDSGCSPGLIPISSTLGIVLILISGIIMAYYREKYYNDDSIKKYLKTTGSENKKKKLFHDFLNKFINETKYRIKVTVIAPLYLIDMGVAIFGLSGCNLENPLH